MRHEWSFVVALFVCGCTFVVIYLGIEVSVLAMEENGSCEVHAASRHDGCAVRRKFTVLRQNFSVVQKFC